MEWTNQDMISAQNIPKKTISCWMKYSGDFIAQQVSFPYSSFGHPDALGAQHWEQKSYEGPNGPTDVEVWEQKSKRSTNGPPNSSYREQ
jgi:hypothetical protein